MSNTNLVFLLTLVGKVLYPDAVTLTISGISYSTLTFSPLSGIVGSSGMEGS
jgi:hypothetical protein